MTENEVTQNATKAKALAPEKLCASNQTYDLIKRELFRRAAQLRGSDQAAFDQLSAYAVVRMENPVMESQDNASGAVNCSGNLSLDLPPGVRIVGGRQTLTSDVDYTVQAAADGSGKIVLLRSADAVIAPLATLARANQQAQISTATAPAPELANEVGSDQQQLDVRTQRQPATVPSPNVSSAAHPSFDCAKARSKGEVAVCSDAGLTALDRNVADQYRTCNVRGIGGTKGAASRDWRSLLSLSRPLPEPLVHRRCLCRPHARDPRHHGRALAASSISVDKSRASLVVRPPLTP